MIAPGNPIGVLGGGQLGRMLAQAAQRMGYPVHVFEPAAGCPAGAVSEREVNAAYEDEQALRSFAADVAVATYEFENIPVSALQTVAERVSVCPAPEVLGICQNRRREKRWLKQEGFPHAQFAEVPAGGDLRSAIRQIGFPCVVKTADFGYDGKGQLKVASEAEVEAALKRFADAGCIVEQWVSFSCELSVVCARSAAGEVRAFPVSENIHTDHILDFSIVPARIDPSVAQEAEQLARAVADRLQVVGLLAAELFVGADGNLLVNELAPRPHNSGHYTLDACFTSQFEQQVRAVCGLPLGDVRLLSPVVMVNLLGDLWARGEPDWASLLRHPGLKLHLYGKDEARPGRKMGHFTVQGPDLAETLEAARKLKGRLVSAAAAQP